MIWICLERRLYVRSRTGITPPNSHFPSRVYCRRAVAQQFCCYGRHQNIWHSTGSCSQRSPLLREELVGSLIVNVPLSTSSQHVRECWVCCGQLLGRGEHRHERAQLGASAASGRHPHRLHSHPRPVELPHAGGEAAGHRQGGPETHGGEADTRPGGATERLRGQLRLARGQRSRMERSGSDILRRPERRDGVSDGERYSSGFSSGFLARGGE